MPINVLTNVTRQICANAHMTGSDLIFCHHFSSPLPPQCLWERDIPHPINFKLPPLMQLLPSLTRQYLHPPWRFRLINQTHSAALKTHQETDGGMEDGWRLMVWVEITAVTCVMWFTWNLGPFSVHWHSEQHNWDRTESLGFTEKV